MILAVFWWKKKEKKKKENFLGNQPDGKIEKYLQSLKVAKGDTTFEN